MAETHLDHPGDITWLKGNMPRTVLGPCPHATCPHHLQSVVAWGPDLDHYELVSCDVPDQCAGQCRAWSRQADRPSGPLMSTPWLHVDRLAWISKAGETAAAQRQARYQETACARRPAEETPDV